ncbi:MAG: response regulator [Acidobacteriaceae bacterium]
METKFETISLNELEARQLVPEQSAFRPVVLVVDDEAIIADTLVVILKNQGYAADAAYSGEAALEKARVVPPELLISDVVMPGMSGIRLAIAITETAPDCKVLLFSGQASTTDLLAEARDSGREFNILTKPIHPSLLLERASTLLQG